MRELRDVEADWSPIGLELCATAVNYGGEKELDHSDTANITKRVVW